MNKKTITTTIVACGFIAAISVPLTAGAKGHHCLGGNDDCAIDDAAVSRIQNHVNTMVKKHDESDDSDRSKPRIAPINTLPEGQSYGRWAVEWQQWSNGTPSPVNPLTDATGEHCAQRQVGNVWFLAGTYQPLSDTVIRNECKIPAGKSLFFALIGTGYGAFLNDPPVTRTEEFVRSPDVQGSCTEPAHITVQIDGFNVPNPTQYFTGASGSLSPIFNVQLPVNNILGLHDNTPNVVGDGLEADELVLSPSAEQGYYLFVRPLSPGAHTIHWTATGCVPNKKQDITYNLTVVGNHH
jgi:hypothetical protein